MTSEAFDFVYSDQSWISGSSMNAEPPKKRGLMRHSGWFSKQKTLTPRVIRQAQPGKDTAVGERNIGKAYVNCCLRGNNSKWGKYQEKDAAILQLLIDPRQDDGFKLKELVLELSFTEGDPRQDITSQTFTIAEPSLLILEPPSPKYLKGRSATQHLSREILAQPQVGAAGVTVGGVGARYTKDKDIEHTWRFHSHWSNNELGVYTNAQWTWKAVAENPDIEDVGSLFAGVVIQHPARPFYLSCRVKGKLVSLDKKFRYGGDDDRPYFTIVNPKPSQESIDKEAEGLEQEIVDLIGRASARVLVSGEHIAHPSV